MIKTAIFVEGQTELIFVREMLMKVFDLNDLGFKCWVLRGDRDDHADYDFPNLGAAFYFDIINVQNDARVATEMVRKERLYWNNGYFRIIGLRDMLDERYRKASQGKGILPELNQKRIALSQEQLKDRAERPADIHLHFAIMEVEAWLLGIKNAFGHLDFSFPETASHHTTGHFSQWLTNPAIHRREQGAFVFWGF
jgi:hypothetical protein